MGTAHAMPFGAALQADGTARFRLWAPDVPAVELVLADSRGRTMRPAEGPGEGWHELTAPAAGGDAYRFRLPGGLLVPDPASRFQPEGPHGPSLVVDPDAYRWRHASWRGRPWHEAVISEIHIGTFTRDGTYRAAAERLPHLAESGITAIELLPLSTFTGERGWGYDGVLPYAPHPAYGNPDELKALIDAAHGLGLMVLLDVVYNHFGPDGNYLNAYAKSFFDEGKHTPWGASIDWREPAVRAFAVENALYWLSEYRFDGLRLDAVHAILDDSATHLLDELGRAVREGPGSARHVHLILENDDNMAARLAAGAPYDAQWNDDWHHCVHVLLTGETDGYYAPYGDDPTGQLARSLAQGFVWQGEASPNHGGEPRGQPSAELPPTAFVNALQNHDQIGNRALGERLTGLASAQAVEVATALMLLSPQVPMLFMGEEWGSTTPFLFFTAFEGNLADAVREGRRKEMGRFPAFADPAQREKIPDPNARATFDASTLDWGDLDRPGHAQRLAFVRRLLELRRTHLVPRLPGTGGDTDEAVAIDRGAVRARWRLGDGSSWHLAVNLGGEPVEAPILPGRRLLAHPEAAAEGAWLPAPSILVTIEEAPGGGGAAGGGPAGATATYRLQFREGMDFAKATSLVPYLAKLGVSHLYASPLTRARAGSTHGYDCADYNELDPALGGGAGFTALTDALKAHGLGLLLDIVPNHMGVGADNPWWWGLLERGADGPHADAFDVDWRASCGATPGKVLLPVLGGPYGEVLNAGELKLVDEDGMRVAYFDNRFPLSPETAAELEGGDLAAASEPARLHAVLERQHYRLAHWRAGKFILNWRRFFDVTELAGVRIEDPKVFDDAHALVLRLMGEGRVQGIRIDHVDGLADPKGYLVRLDRALRDAGGGSPHARGGPSPPWVLVEKILGEGERLPKGWPVAGTTGYEALCMLTGLQLDPEGLDRLEALYRERTGAAPFAEVVREAKRDAVHRLFPAEIERLTQEAHRLLGDDPVARDLPPPVLRVAIEALARGFKVYRIYAGGERPSAEDERRLGEALEEAREDGADPAALDAIARLARAGRPEHLAFARRLQQTTGPLMAKALEDTAFYRWHRLVAANEVGGEPGHPAVALTAFHTEAALRAKAHPHALIATATHDTKRGEDVRARLAVLSELPELWREAVERWLERDRDEGVEVNDLWLLWQTVIGAWPLDLGPTDADGLAAFAKRITAYMEKALREAKRRTSWTEPDAAYEAAVAGLIRRRLEPGSDFAGEAAGVVARIAPAGALNGLAQTLIKLVMPGIPDLYQGGELWELSLVDPDNRRPPDWAVRAAALDADVPLPERLAGWRSGAVKLGLIQRALEARRRSPELFTSGRYRPLTASGAQAGHVLAFARGEGAAAAIAVAPLRCAHLLGTHDTPLVPAEAWGDTAITLPDDLATRVWRDATTGAGHGGAVLRVGELLAGFPVALLVAG